MVISLALAVLLLALYLGEVLFIYDNHARLVAADITSPVTNLFAVAALLLGAWQSRRVSRRLALAWGVLALAQLCYTLGDIVWAVLEAGLGQPPFPSFADGFYLVYYPLFFAGLLLLPTRRYSRGEWIRKLLDISIIGTAAALFFWNFIISPRASAGFAGPYLNQALSLAYPIGDLLLLSGLLALLYNRQGDRDQHVLLLLGASTTAMIVTDSLFSIQSLSGTYASGGFVDVGWTAGYLLAGMAGIFQTISARRTVEAPSVVKAPRVGIRGVNSSFLLDTLASTLPYLWLVCAFALLVTSHVTSLPMSFYQVAMGVAFIIVLFVARQVSTLMENRRLFLQLQGALERVQQQAAELEKTNRNLTAEIAERERVQRQLSHDALHDGLTGLPNRALFYDRLSHAIDAIQHHPDHSTAVLFLDLDHFKVINDSLGHTIGDRLLVTIAERLRMFLRATDTIARLSGDEFVILLEDAGQAEQVAQITGRILEVLRLPFDNIGGHEVFATTSIGVVADIAGYTTPEEVLQDADIALYRAKMLGRARYEIFTPDLRVQAVTRLQMENELRHAIEHEEFQLHYQPIYILGAQQITGFEALLRWNHPRRGLLDPGEFLQVAEETGLILAISKWVLRQACMQLSQWQKAFPERHPLTMHVNVSSKQFSQPDFVEQVEKTLRDTGLCSGALRLEITERVVIDNQAQANAVFARLNHLGVQLEVDDFGTGYSSLSYLQHFPIKTIKIDRSFVEEMSKPGKNADLVRTMIMMAKSLGMDTIAEGVETPEQLEILKDMDCPLAQGFLLSRPLDEVGAEMLLWKSAQAQPEQPNWVGKTVKATAD